MLAGVLGSAIACLLTMAVQAPALAEQGTATVSSTASETEARTRDTNEGLLAALLVRRSEIPQSEMSAEQKRYALEFLDRQIARLRAELRSPAGN